MGKKALLEFDKIGMWSEIKLEIIEAYAKEYTKILSHQNYIKSVYIDAFSGAGVHKSKTSGEDILGSPLKVLSVNPKFYHYYFIDLDPAKSDYLKTKIGNRENVSVYRGDCNSILSSKILPKVQYKDYMRGLCLLDPYGLHLDWKIIQKVGEMKTIEIFLNFPITDMNRNVFWNKFEGVDEADIKRMTLYWGDESWRNIAYTTNKNLFGYIEKEEGGTIAKAFQARLRNIAKFNYVSEPLPMRNSKNAVVYYLFFASQKPVAKKIVDHIFNKYAKSGMIQK
ncbi:MAG: three-Cys-motif partner protein TcmP [Candidatus Omnitrophota bacterium]